MRFYLDTNILIFSLLNTDELSYEVKEMISDYGNFIFTSSVCVHELIHLCQIGRLERLMRKENKLRAKDVMPRLTEAGMKIIPVNGTHLASLATLPLYSDNHDPFDRLIVAQAISDKIPLISSDSKFHSYSIYGLDFIFNER